MATVTGAVEKIESVDRNTKRGPAPVFYVWVNGEKYNLGFKRLSANVGDVVTFDAERSTYGWEAKTHPVPSAGGSTAPAKPAGASTGSWGSKGVFPIPALDGQRSIVRQNALTNAIKFLERTPVTGDLDKDIDTIIHIARMFEGYTAGDTDAAQAEKELKEATITTVLKKEK